MGAIGKLHLLTDVVLQSRFSHEELARLGISGGADTIQFRQKTGSTREMIEVARRIKRICEEKTVSFIVNDRIDVAIASEADGVHLGREDFPIPLARKLLGPGKVIGGSASTLEEALACVSEGADYIGFGPVYDTTSKLDAGPAGGISLLQSVVKRVQVPVIAIGGISVENAREVMKAGAAGIAVISAICCQEDPLQATRALKKAMESG
ncbi:MAG: thiamine phosphate synthase [Deltaproteobacteria bacterium]|nr:thiamine phosphate synthase [Deltaproteobacteria bacterium]